MSSDNEGLVLIIDDDVENLPVVSSLLTSAGYETYRANSGKKALAAVEQVLPDLILLDVRMPGMDGFETCVRLKQNPRLKDVPVVFMSGLNDLNVTIKGFESGATDFIAKPFRRRELLARVGAHLSLARTTRDLAAANERLKELDRMKSSFIASVNHELRTPLNSIIGFTGLILQGISGPLTDQQEDELKRVYKAARHLLGMIADIIEISKIDGGNIDLQLEKARLAELMEPALDKARKQAESKGLRFEAHCPRKLEIVTDRKRMLQCLDNVLNNAVKFTEEGTVALRVTEANGTVVIQVADTGIGLTDEEAKKLFSPFSRLKSARNRRIEGTGLGLFLTKKIADEILGGAVSGAPNRDGGSTFTLTIPQAGPRNAPGDVS